jgi:hypothetical protein
MDAPRSLGQLCYETWWRAFSDGTQTDLDAAWQEVSPQGKRAWDAVAGALMQRLLHTLPQFEGLAYPRQVTIVPDEPPPAGPPAS